MEFNILDIIQHMLNIFVLYILLRVLLYNPVRKFILARMEKEAEKRSQIENSLQEAEALYRENESKIGDLTADAARRAEERLALAEENARDIVARAKEDAAMLISEARDRIAEERQSEREIIEKQTAELATDLAQYILKREIKKEDNLRFIKEYFKELGQKHGA